jgi:hypothetical protein
MYSTDGRQSVSIAKCKSHWAGRRAISCDKIFRYIVLIHTNQPESDDQGELDWIQQEWVDSIRHPQAGLRILGTAGHLQAPFCLHNEQNFSFTVRNTLHTTVATSRPTWQRIKAVYPVFCNVKAAARSFRPWVAAPNTSVAVQCIQCIIRCSVHNTANQCGGLLQGHAGFLIGYV